MRSPTNKRTKLISLRLTMPVLLLLCAGVLSGCKNGSEAAAPTDVVVTPGDGRMTVTWTMQPGVQYWMFYAPAASISVDNWVSLPGSAAVVNVTSPYTLNSLVNGTTYAVTINGRYDSGPGGPGTASVTAIPRLAGASWNLGVPALTLAGGTALRANTFGTKFVTVGDSSTIYSSSDGVTWAAPTTAVPSTVNLNGITYSGQYIAVGATGAVLTSPDANTWTLYDNTVTGTSYDLLAVATNGAGLYVAVGQHDTILYSNNLTTWTAANYTGTLNNLNAITYANGQFVVVGNNGTILTSTDGINWNSVGSNTASDNLNAVAYSAINTTYCAVGVNGLLYTSTDNGVTWNPQTAIGGSPTLRALIYATQFIAVGDNGSTYASTDGINWQSTPAPLDGANNPINLYGIAHGNYGYIAVGNAGNYITAY